MQPSLRWRLYLEVCTRSFSPCTSEFSFPPSPRHLSQCNEPWHTSDPNRVSVERPRWNELRDGSQRFKHFDFSFPKWHGWFTVPSNNKHFWAFLLLPSWTTCKQFVLEVIFKQTRMEREQNSARTKKEEKLKFHAGLWQYTSSRFINLAIIALGLYPVTSPAALSAQYTACTRAKDTRHSSRRSPTFSHTRGTCSLRTDRARLSRSNTTREQNFSRSER